MRVNRTDNQTFTSAFRFQKMKQETYESLRHLVPLKSRSIFTDSPSEDVVHVNHSCYDERIRKFINDNNISFEYFPRIKLSDKLTKEMVNYLIMRDIKKKKCNKKFFCS